MDVRGEEDPASTPARTPALHQTFPESPLRTRL